MKIFVSVLGALIAFSVLCGLGYYIYCQNQETNVINKCLDNAIKTAIRDGEYNTVTPDNKILWREQCSQMIEGE